MKSYTSSYFDKYFLYGTSLTVLLKRILQHSLFFINTLRCKVRVEIPLIC